MNIINWSDFSGDSFQSFCNDLLSFKIGKDFVPYSAPGGDQGIDGFFDGKYNGKNEKWRFQAKFHHPNTGRVAGFNQLKNQVRKDIPKNIQDETKIIFITNVELNPGQRKEIKNIAGELLNEDYRCVEFDIWDGAKLNTLLSHHPIVKLWYTSQTKHLIQEYSEFYHNELDKTTNTIYEFSNKFYHRKDKLKAINKFISDDIKTTALISGEVGIGKTRLCVEFFKQYIDQNNDWKALVITSYKIDLQILQVALTGEKNYVVLIDDADKFDAKDIADLLTLIKSIKDNIVKLLLTVRSTFLEQVLSHVSYGDRTEKVKQIKLDQLTREETVKFLKAELKNYRIGNYLGYFVELTHGAPIMIMTLLRVIRNGVPFSDIKRDTFLKQYVKQYFDQFTEATSNDKGIDKREVKNLIELFALIEPIQIEDEGLIQQIASIENISEEDTEIILQAMKSQNIISGHYHFDIKPDIYSDFILEEALNYRRVWLKKKIHGYGTYINNIIKNIGYTYQNNQDDDNIFQNLLRGYIDQIDTCSNNLELTKILDTVNEMTYRMPLLGEETVKKVLSIYNNAQHPLNKKFQKSLTEKNYSFDSTINNIKLILYSLFQLEDYFLRSYSYSGQLYQLTKDDGIISNIAGFGKSDQFEDFNCKRQNQILTASTVALDSANENMSLFALKSLKLILKLEFTGAHLHLYQKHSIQIYTLIIPENKHVKNLRKETINTLIGFFQRTSSKVLKEEAFKIVFDVPREIFATRKNNTYKGKEDIKIVFDFLLSISSENILELNQKKYTKDQLHWFKRWGIDSSYYEIIDKIKDNLSENDLAEQLMDLFSPNHENLEEEKKQCEVNSRILVNENSGIDLGNALVKVIAQSEYEPYHFYKFLYAIASDLDKTIRFINHLWETNKSFVILYCSNIFRKLRFSESHEKIYWVYVQKLQTENTIEALNCVLYVYNSFRIHDVLNNQNDKKNVLKKKDINLIITLFKNSTERNYYNLASTLPTLFFFDKSIAIDQIEKFLENCNEQQLDNLLLGFDPIKEKYYHDIKKMILKRTLHLNIPYRVQLFLGEIIQRDGFQEVLSYIENRFHFKRKYVLENKSLLRYEYIPTLGGSSITNRLSEKQKKEIFSMIINWFVDFDFKSYENFYAKDIVKLFKVQGFIDQHAKAIYEKLIDKYKTNYDKLMNIARSLSEFKRKNEDYMDLVIKLLKTGNQNIKDRENLEKLKAECYISLTSLGVKAGTSGQPFSVDLELRELLENTLKKVKDPKIKGFFLSVLKSVQADIDRDRESEGGAW